MRRTSCVLIAFIFLEMGCGSSEPPIAGGKTSEHWIEELQNEKVAVRIEAVKKLGNIGSKDPDALPAVFEALLDKAPAVRKEAIYAVVRNRSASREALPLLEEMKDADRDAKIRKIADEAYRNLTDSQY